MMKTFKWHGPYYFVVDIPKMHVYISETLADINYDVIKMAAKNSQHLLFGPLLNRHSALYLFDYLIFQVLVDVIISE